jgi:hypothetical protein
MPVVRVEVAGRWEGTTGSRSQRDLSAHYPHHCGQPPRAGKRDGTIIQTTADNKNNPPNEDNNQAISLDRRGNMA